MKLLYYPNKTLEIPALPLIDLSPDKLIKKSRQMFKIMRENGGVGLSGCQVGWPVSLFCIETKDFKETIINPEIISLPSTKEVMLEGCLSHPGLWLELERPNAVLLKYNIIGGDTVTKLFEGLECRIILHEIQHLNGIKFA